MKCYLHQCKAHLSAQEWHSSQCMQTRPVNTWVISGEHLRHIKWIPKSYQVNTWVISGELLKHLCNVYLPKASQGRWGKSKKNKEEKRFVWCWHACLNRLYFACPKAEGIVRPSCEARLVTGRWSRVSQCEVNQKSGFQVAAYQWVGGELCDSTTTYRNHCGCHSYKEEESTAEGRTLVYKFS